MSNKNAFTCRGPRRALRVSLGVPRWPHRSALRFNKSTARKRGGSYPAAPTSFFLRIDFLLRNAAIGCSRTRLPAGLRLGAGPLPRVVSQNQLVSGNLVLRHDMEGAPRRRSGEGMLDAAVRLRLHSKIIPQESGAAGLGRTRPDSEDMIWQSKMRRKGASGGPRERHAVLSWVPDM